MGIKLCRHFAILVIGVLAIMGFTRCGDEITEVIEKTEITNIIGSEVITRDVEVKENQWGWNGIYHRYEYTEKMPEINKALYEFGTIAATIYIVEDASDGSTYEVQKNLPFVQTYKDLAVPYTEIISFDIFYGDGTDPSVTFYIQTSDGSDVTPVLPPVYYFKLALIWDSEG